MKAQRAYAAYSGLAALSYMMFPAVAKADIPLPATPTATLEYVFSKEIQSPRATTLDALIENNPSLLQRMIILEKSGIEYIDGDTIRYEGKRIRLVGFDSAERGQEGDDENGLFHYWSAECTARTKTLIEGADDVGALVEEGRQTYGRELWNIILIYDKEPGILADQEKDSADRKYQLLSISLILNGEAYEYASPFESDYTGIREANIEAGKKGKKPGYQPPSQYRKNHPWKNEPKGKRFKEK